MKLNSLFGVQYLGYLSGNHLALFIQYLLFIIIRDSKRFEVLYGYRKLSYRYGNFYWFRIF
jgi:hypothetical protein